jgi:preprotein translocase subunit SecD
LSSTRTSPTAFREPEDVLRLVYRKAAARRRRRIGVASVVVMLVVAIVVSGTVAAFDRNSSQSARYSAPASVPRTDLHGVASTLAERFRALGYSDARTSIAGSAVTVRWHATVAADRSTLDTLGEAGMLSLRPVVSTHSFPCQSQPASPPPGASFEVTDPTTTGVCLVLGPADLIGLAVQSAQAAVGPTGQWYVQFAVASQDSAALDDFAAHHYQQQVVILVDDIPLAAPTVHTTSFGGRGQIVGDFSQARAKALSFSLRYRLPISLTVQPHP